MAGAEAAVVAKEVTHVVGHDVDWLCHRRNRLIDDRVGSLEPLLFGFSLSFRLATYRPALSGGYS